MTPFLRHRLAILDERRKRKLMRLWYDYADDCGEFVTVLIGLVLCVLVCAVVWMAIIEIERWMR
jgi:hypothetical protein